MLEAKRHERLIGESSHFLQVLEDTSRLAPLNKPVLLIGERGTGKELIAERLHFLSSRWDQPFVKINCATFHENLLESELFGHEAGAFTGANKRRAGRFERADGGSLFLDELASTSAPLQEKLLRVIEYGEFERLGGSSTMKVNVRLIAASNLDLPSLAKEGKFREDLLDRLAFDVITLPPLRYRQEDIPLLAEHFAVNMCLELGRELFPGFSSTAMDTLLNYQWPGNVRELKNAVERNVYRHSSDQKPVDNIVLDPFASPFRIKNPVHTEDEHVPQTEAPETTQQKFPVNLRELVSKFETDLIEQSLEVAQYNQRKAAELLGVTYHQLRGYIRKYQLLKE